MKALIIANGEPPAPELLGKFAKSADIIIATDGAGEKFFADVIIGDLDSLKTAANPHARIICRPSQESCDFTKAVKFALSSGAREINILGAGGLRDDHAIANFALFCRFGCIRRGSFGCGGAVGGAGGGGGAVTGPTGATGAQIPPQIAVKIRMHSNFGTFLHLRDGESLELLRGTQVSIFARSQADRISASGLKFPLVRRRLYSANAATLNEALGGPMRLQIEPARSFATVFVLHGGRFSWLANGDF